MIRILIIDPTPFFSRGGEVPELQDRRTFIFMTPMANFLIFSWKLDRGKGSKSQISIIFAFSENKIILST